MDLSAQEEVIYQHQPLENEGDIRILAVHPGEFSSPIECSIENANLDAEQKPQYFALSYCWGDPAEKAAISIGGKLLWITQNLQAALRQLRPWEDPPVYLWVDAVCINQNDNEERGRQVRRMKDIYEKAMFVFAWLGPAKEDSVWALSIMGSLQVFMKSAVAAHAHEMDATTIADLGMRFFLYQAQEVGHDGVLDPRFKEAAKDLFGRDWWLRVWIVQEATTSNTTMIACGEICQPWETVKAAFIPLMRLAVITGICPDITEVFRAWNIQLFRTRREEGGYKMGLLEILDFMRVFEATDLRDKVYASIGLANDVRTDDFVIDYNKPVHEVYIDVAKFCITKKNTLDWLAYAGDGRDKDPLLPSWAPDWNCKTLPEPLPTQSYCADGALAIVYMANPQPFCNDTNRPVLSAEDMTLTIKGFCFDRLASLGEEAAGDNLDDTSVEKSWAPSNPTDIYNLTGETMEEAYLTTIVAGVTWTGDGKVLRGGSMVWSAEQEEPEEDLMRKLYLNRDWLTPLSSLKAISRYRRLAYTRDGYMCMVPGDAQIGDKVYIISGSQLPFVLREEADGCHKLIGATYVHGLMYGDAMWLLPDEEFKVEQIRLR